MDSAQLYRKRAKHLRQLAAVERDVSVRQQLALAALGFDEFANELESRETMCGRHSRLGSEAQRAA